MSFLDLTSELTGILPGLSPLLAEKYVNRAWGKIRDERRWSFLLTDGAVVCPMQITAGTAAFAQYTSTATMDATASAALLDQATIATQPGLTNLQIRFASTSPSVGQIYNIIAVDVTNPALLVLTLDRVIMEASSAALGYQVYRCYVTPPMPDFLAWVSVTDMTQGWSLRMDYTSRYFDLRDPQRQSQGVAYYLGGYEAGRVDDIVSGVVRPNPNQDTGAPIYELWPQPTSGQTFYTRFHRRGQDFVLPTDTQPAVIADALILHAALSYYAYPFAQANVANFPTFKGAGWQTLIATERASYREELLDAKRNDDETMLQNVWNRGHGLLKGDGRTGYFGPVDANYLQSHLVRF